MKPAYSCVLKPTKRIILKSKKWTAEIKGVHVKIPSRELFITNSGVVFVVTNKKGQSEYTALTELVAVIRNTRWIENFSK